MNQLIAQLKESEQDFEFYPTTDEIIRKLTSHLIAKLDYRSERDSRTFLDIGAGHGKVIDAMRKARWDKYGREDHKEPLFSEFYAIEKSTILCQKLPPDVFIIGTDFQEQSLISKNVWVTFSNPPYSEFTDWAVKVIRESSSRYVFLVIPTRWQESLDISAALSFRNAEAEIVGEFSFEDAEDRRARAKVHLLCIELNGDKDDAFDRFFDEQFGELKEKFRQTKERQERNGDTKVDHDKNPKFSQLVVGPSYPEALVALYNEEMDHVRKNYDLVSKLDADLLREFDVTPSRILGCLKARLAGLRNIYWQELFGNFGKVTDRLCSKKRKALLTTLNRSGAVDFTFGNIHAVVLWVLKNANQYLDEQLIETFEDMVEKANVRNYKSNQRVFGDDKWRYTQEKPTHIALEFRLVLDRCGGVCKSAYRWEKGLTERGADFLGDLLTVARNLGFECKDRDQLIGKNREEWEAGKTRTFTMKKLWEVGDKVPWGERTRKTITNKVQLDGGAWQYCLGDDEWVHEACLPGETLIEVRPFLNSNMHVRLNQKFALALNVEYGRLKGWLRNGAEAADELGDEEAVKFFKSQLVLGPSSLLMLA